VISLIETPSGSTDRAFFWWCLWSISAYEEDSNLFAEKAIWGEFRSFSAGDAG
jgi:hypothetical protein